MADASSLESKCLTLSEADEVNFAEPWQAKAFGIIVKMSGDGHFSWAEWVEVFSQEVTAASVAEAAGLPAPSYYEQWLAAAEKLMVAKGITSREQLAARRFAIGSAGPAHVLK
jgi:nitrile hydratase accessory protein